MKILVTGSNGLLGQKLVDKLSKRDDIQLVATGRGENRNPQGNYRYSTLDITSSGEVHSLFEEIKPEVVINTAAMTQVDECELNPEECWNQNVIAVKHLVDACEKVDAFFIHLSTDFIFDGASGPYKEEDEPNPLSKYAESKLESEKIVKSSTTKWAIVRTMLVYGIAHDMSRSNIILWVKKNLEDKKPIKVVNDQWRMPTLAEDLADGCILVTDKLAQGVYHISGKDMLPPYVIALKTADFFQLDKSLIEEVDGSIFSQPAKRPARTGFVLDKAFRDLNYDPHSFEEGIAVIASQIS
jgi:dTDP-4-dehydrorhamnose reductase